jgi:hypothetical protein
MPGDYVMEVAMFHVEHRCVNIGVDKLWIS